MAHVETDLGFKWDVLKDLDEFKALKELIKESTDSKNSVSYTHLTLPTIYSV